MLANTKRSVYLNLIHLGLVYFFIFCAYRVLEYIQSSLNYEAGLGTNSLSVLYAGFFVSCLVLGAPMVYKLGPKWAIFASLFSHFIFILANAFPRYYTMIPAASILGILSAPIWIAQGIYVTHLATELTLVGSLTKAQALKRCNGIFFALHGLSGPVGSLVSAVVLRGSLLDDWRNNNSSDVYMYEGAEQNGLNVTVVNDYKEHCGMHHCPYLESHLEALEKPDQILVLILIAVFLLFNITGIVSSFFLKNIRHAGKISSPRQKILDVFHMFKSADLLLMATCYLHMGISPTIFYGSFLQSFISCEYGIHTVGYTMFAHGMGSILCPVLLTRLSNLVSRKICIAFFILLEMCMITSWFFWDPKENQLWIAILYGFVHGTIHNGYKVEFTGMTSLIFEENLEPAFAHFHLWGGVACAIGFALTSRICFFVKAVIAITSVSLMSICLILVEIRFKRKTNRNVVINTPESKAMIESIDKA